jgi:uncharacterized protein (DUF433 family)
MEVVRLPCYMPSMDSIDWKACAAIETVPAKLSGQPVIRGTRVRPIDLIVNRDEGMPWLVANFGIPEDTVRAVFAFYDQQAHAPHPA